MLGPKLGIKSRCVERVVPDTWFMEAHLDRDGLEAMKVPELRAALATQGLDSTGIKRELVDRLLGLDNGGAEPTAAPVSEVEPRPTATAE